MNFEFTIIAVLFLILCSSFFSCSETAMMALNKYKVKHLAKKNVRAAKRCLNLIRRPDQLLSMILIGNTFANIIVSAILTTYAEKNFGHLGIIISTFVLTIIILLFAEIIPKTIAAIYPQKIAFLSSGPIKVLLVSSYPVVYFLNIIAHGFLLLFGLRIKQNTIDPLSSEEMHSVVNASENKLGNLNKNMLIGVLELNIIKVSDVMIPYHQVEFINLKQSPKEITKKVLKTKYSILLVCDGNTEKIIGTILVKTVLKFIAQNDSILNYQSLLNLINKPYYIPRNVSIKTQLVNFQKKGLRFAVIVSEYGNIEGIITVEDIIEEIVGEFSDNYNLKNHIKTNVNQEHITKGHTTVREVNRHLNLHLPTNHAKTISGMIINELKEIPAGPCCLKIENYLIQVEKIQNNMIKTIKIIKA